MVSPVISPQHGNTLHNAEQTLPRVIIQNLSSSSIFFFSTGEYWSTVTQWSSGFSLHCLPLPQHCFASSSASSSRKPNWLLRAVASSIFSPTCLMCLSPSEKVLTSPSHLFGSLLPVCSRRLHLGSVLGISPCTNKMAKACNGQMLLKVQWV